jgi:hypothetical protein
MTTILKEEAQKHLLGDACQVMKRHWKTNWAVR